MWAAAQLLRRRSAVLVDKSECFRRYSLNHVARTFLVARRGLGLKHPENASTSTLFSTSASGGSSPAQAPKSSGSTFNSGALKLVTTGVAIATVSAAAWYTIQDKPSQVLGISVPPQIFPGKHVEYSPREVESEQHSAVARDARELENAESEVTSTETSKPEHVEEVVEHLKDDVLEDTVQYEHEEKGLGDSDGESPQSHEIIESITEVVEIPVIEQGHGVRNEESDELQDQGSVLGFVKDLLHISENREDQDTDETPIETETDKRVSTDANSEEKELSQPVQELNEVLEGSHRAPEDSIRLSPSYLIQSGHEGNLRRYLLKTGGDGLDNVVVTPSILREGEQQHHQAERNGSVEDASSAGVIGTEVLVGAIHTAAQLQAEADALLFKEQLEKLTDEHRRVVGDYHTQLLTYTEDLVRLEKELKMEKQKSQAQLRSLHESAEAKLLSLRQNLEEKLETQLKEKEEAWKKDLERLLLLEKTRTAATRAKYNVDNLLNTSNLRKQVEALRVAFYTSSEEARISHTAHKLAMGAVALENAVESGDPVEKEVVLLVASAGGLGADPLIDTVLGSLPTETFKEGTANRAQLYHKFVSLKGPLRELVLIPTGGGGFLAHMLARAVSIFKVSELGLTEVGSRGIEAVLGSVETLLAEGRLVEAATTLVKGAKGTKAEKIAAEWAKQARHRALIEQALSVVQAHVITVSAGLA